MYNGPQNRFRTYSRLPQTIDIRLGDNTVIQATHKGLVQVQNHWINALHLPTFRYSLLSVGDLDFHGYRTSFETGRCLISDRTNQKVIMTGQKNGMLYELDTNRSTPDSINAALVTSEGKKKLSIAESRIWHKRLGHLGDAAVKSIINGYVDDGSTCEVCIQAKLRRKIIRVPVQRTSTPFELVHSDLCGPFATRSAGGAQYFIIYVDDYSRHTELTVLPDKRAETCTAAFQWFQAKVDGWGYDIRRFRSDNGSGEYNNKNFRSILAVRGIAFEPCPPHTQHKNGIAERMIGVLTQKARAMMLDSQAPMQFWAEAINTACYLHRRTPNQSLDGKTPYEVLKRHRRLYRNGNSRVSTAIGNSNVGSALDDNSRSMSTASDNSRSMSTASDNSQSTNTTSAEDKPTLDHLRRFGCVVWKHIPKSQRMDTKMGARAKACMMLGYVHDTTKIWRIRDPDFGKAINCSDVYFDESRPRSRPSRPS